jgi:S1-C subfamily serine protease
MAHRIVSGLMGAAMIALATPAMAQEGLDGLMTPEQQAELYCVYDMLSQSGEAASIAGVFVDPDATDSKIEGADAILSDAIDECLLAYTWTDEMRGYAAAIGIHGSVIELLTANLVEGGLSEETVQVIFDALDLLDEADMETFKSPEWLTDTRFRKRINRTLIAAGLPNDKAVLSNSLLVMESSVLTVDAIVDWLLEAGVGSQASKAPAGNKKSKAGRAKAAVPREPKLELTGSGTGWYVADGGYLVTNAHVVEGCKRMTLKSGAELDIIDVAVDEDLALLRGGDSLAPLSLRSARNVRLAEDVLIAGFPLGGILSSGINVTTGSVSALAGLGDDERRFQFTAPVQPGNSGGPVLDMSGNVVGVVVSKLNAMSIQDQIGDIPQNVNFGIGLQSLFTFLDTNDVAYNRQASGAKLEKVDLAEMARASTVLLQCYQ